MQCGRPRFDTWVGKIPWRREWLPTSVFWPGELHGLYSPWGCKGSDMTEGLSLSLWTFFGIALLWDWNENWPFQFCGHCWVFQIGCHFEGSTLTTSSFRICRSLARIASPQLTLIKVMHPKAHLTSHSRTSGSRSVITPLCLSGSWRSFLYSSSVASSILATSS